MSDEEVSCIGHEPCPACGSRDNLARYSDGHGFCFGCQHYEHSSSPSTVQHPSTRVPNHTGAILSEQLITDGVYADLTKRGITEDTCRHFGYTKGKYHGRSCQIANYHDAAGVLVAQKLRFAPNPDGSKDFMVIGDLKQASFFGSHLYGKGKMIVITEGEIDALSVAQTQQCKWPVVSLPTGAAGARRSIAKNLDYLSNFESVVLMFDNDEPGRKAAQECAEALGPSRCKIATLPLKDANEMLQAGRSSELVAAMWNARPYKPEGVLAGTDLLDIVLAEDSSSEAIPYPWESLNEKTYGLRTSEIVLFTAGTGVGKSAFVRELGYYLGNVKQQNVGWIMLEESTKRTALGIMSLHRSLPLHIPQYREKVNVEEMKTLFEQTLGTGRYYLIKHFGSGDPDTLLNRIRYLVTGLECKWIILDHISMIVSGMAEGDERRLIDNIMTKLAELVEELNFGLLLVCHLRRPQGEGHENGAEITLSHLRGSAALGQLSHIVIGAERDQQGEQPNLSKLRVLKNRHSGDTGIGCYLLYDKATGRLFETTKEFAETDAKSDTFPAAKKEGEDF